MTTKKSPRKEKIGRNIVERGELRNGRSFQQSYPLLRLLGRGGFASCYETKMGEKRVAIKIMNKKNKNNAKHATYNEEKIRMEIDIISRLKHGGVVGYFHSFDDAENTYLIQELCTNGTLGDVIKSRKMLTEPQVRFLIVQLVNILLYIKSKNIIHRDIKPANIFIGQNFQLKLGDFGLAVYNDEHFRAKRGMCGTPNYIAPQVITKQSYSFEVDTWSTGVLIFTLLFGVAPFETKTCELTYEKIKTGVYKFQGSDKSIRVSQDAKDFLGRILVLDQKKRLKIQEFLNHPFMVKYTIPTYVQPNFCRSNPSLSYTKKFGKAVKDKKQNISRTNSLMQTKQIQATLKTTKNTYKDILHNERTSTRAGATNSPHSDSDNNVKEESSEMRNSKIVSKRIDNRCYESPNKIREEQFDRIQYGNKKGRKKFRYENAEEEQTHKKFDKIIITPQKRVEKMQKNVEHQEYFLKNRIKYSIRSKIRTILTIDFSFPRPVIVTKHLNCIETFGLCYYLSNNEFGFVFNDASKMISLSDKKILYIYRKNSEVIKETFDLDGKRSDISPKMLVKIQAFNEFKEILGKGNNPPTPNDDSKKQTKNSQIYVKNFKILKSMILCKLSDNSLQCLFQDGTSALISLESKFIFYQKGNEELYYALPLAEDNKMDPFLREKLQQFCDFFRDAVNKRGAYTKTTPLWNLPTNLYACKSNPEIKAV